ncbi:MAG: hypothetical protein ACKVQU_04045 [Burkholderiales bacterium]
MTQHEVITAYERDWATLKNGNLLDAAEADGFATLVVSAIDSATEGSYTEVEIP